MINKGREETGSSATILAEKDRIIAEKDVLIEKLKADIRSLIEEKEEMIDSFKTSTNILLEKIKDLESQKTGYRPQTANILARPKNDKRVGGGDSSRRITGKAIKNNVELQAEWEREIPEDPGNEEERKASEMKKCTNCQRLIPEDDFDAHTITCYRNVTKCKICGEYIPNNAKISHLSDWRNPKKILDCIQSANQAKLKLCFQHGAEINYQVAEEGNTSYLHLAVKKGVEDVFSVLMGFGINIELIDDEGNTPLILAAQNENFNIFKSLIEVGANLDAKNKIGWTPLFYACKRGDKNMVEYLVENGAKLTESTALGDNSLKIAEKYGHQEIARMLVAKGVSLRSSKGFKLLNKYDTAPKAL